MVENVQKRWVELGKYSSLREAVHGIGYLFVYVK
jgi:hypothetical protein